MSNHRCPPSTRPFRRTSGRRRCPSCNEWHRVGGNATARPDTGKQTCYLRALVEVDTKQWIIDQALVEGVSISALVRRMVLFYRSNGHD